jgi:hypothetical protein
MKSMERMGNAGSAGTLKRLMLLAAALVLVALPAAAHEGHTHRYMGTIAAASDSSVSLKTADGKTMSFKLDETTRITKGKAAGGAKDLTVGARAVVEAEGGKPPQVARSIKLAAASKST